MVTLRLHRVFASTWSATPSDFPTVHNASSRSLETADGHRPHPAESDRTILHAGEASLLFLAPDGL